jgi:hypothetical protein
MGPCTPATRGSRDRRLEGGSYDRRHGGGVATAGWGKSHGCRREGGPATVGWGKGGTVASTEEGLRPSTG